MRILFFLFSLSLDIAISYKVLGSQFLLNRESLKQVDILSLSHIPVCNEIFNINKPENCNCASCGSLFFESFRLNLHSVGNFTLLVAPEQENKEGEQDNGGTSTIKTLMLDAIKFYRRSLSPLMPPNCRFLPTCSSYGLEAIEKYGPWKGGILTAWRILRCNPFGGKGYDPPQWPPPNFFAGSTGRFK